MGNSRSGDGIHHPAAALLLAQLLGLGLLGGFLLVAARLELLRLALPFLGTAGAHLDALLGLVGALLADLVLALGVLGLLAAGLLGRLGPLLLPLTGAAGVVQGLGAAGANCASGLEHFVPFSGLLLLSAVEQYAQRRRPCQGD
mgnify:CR=1 FL=1